ncbi:sensor histidine kinase [Clostridium sp. Maddingley MBC34-26]|uniref:cache domain-containing sensor histidine kinase n=2 Tax=unclassified Clostridium TaxID=2614128 RepID=UPI000297CA68|nr:sensor histidine kinase [Clostridium sp. Maddingley MBC34-26]EKQ58309.1 MAG: HAMP domain-containing protein,histidine kinase [Clostridium sp. Maddingley MBC34-26]
MYNGLRKLIDKLFQMKFNQKITTFFILTVLITNTFVIFAVYQLAGKQITEKSSGLVQGQLDTITDILNITLKNIIESSNTITGDNRVKEFLMNNSLTSKNYNKDTSDAYSSVRYLLDTNSYIDYISLVKFDGPELIYVGEVWTSNDFRTQTLKDYQDAVGTKFGNCKISMKKKVFYPDQYVLNIYQPITDKYNFNKYTGVLVIGIGEKSIKEFYSNLDKGLEVQTYLTDKDGVIISNEDKSLIGTKSFYKDILQGKSGQQKVGDKMVIYEKLDNWDWYMVGEIPTESLLKDTNAVIFLIIMLVLGAGILISIAFYKLSNNLYKPMDALVKKMREVSMGNLEVRMERNYKGKDFKQLASGFNIMIEEINILMYRIKREQSEIKQIELNKLQSQIKPHFLYNTLECIHWQALSDGNKDVSRMVKALANYYRLCLSKGKDIVPLSQELANIENYLIIQNMRYSGIAQCEININDNLKNVLIPKLTLQPLIENSIYHGIRVKDGYKGKIFVNAKEIDNKIVISVADNGVGMNQEQIDEINNSISVFDEKTGYGLRNVHKRIEILFGSGYGLYYRKNQYGGTTVDIILPKGENGENN